MFRLCGLRFIFFSVLVLCIASLAYGQDTYTSGFYTRGAESADFLDRDDAILAPFYMPLPSRWALIPRLTITSSYENNPALTAEEARNDAVTTYIIPGLMLIYGQRQRNHLYVDAGVIFPVDTDSEEISEDVSYLLALGGGYRIGKTSLGGRLGYRQMENVDTLVGARLIRRDYMASLSLERRVSRKFSVGGSGNSIWFVFDDPRYLDYRRLYGAGQVYYRLNPRSDLFVQGGVGQDRVEERGAQLGDADFYDISIGARGQQTPKTQVSGRLGYRWREGRNPEGSVIEHYIAAVEAETSPFGLSTFSAGLQADIRPAVSAGGFSTVDQRGTFSATRRIIWDRLRARGALFLGQVEYYGPRVTLATTESVSTAVYDGRQDEYWGYSLGLDVWTIYNFSFGISYSYFENRGARNGAAELQELTSYDSARWGLRGSWNY